MYIFELIAKILFKSRGKKMTEPDSVNDIEICEHFYLPIDSSKGYLACNKCGNVIKNEFKS